MECRSSARGVALPLVVMMLGVMAAVAAATLYPATVERRLAANALRLRQALAAAESGVAIRRAQWGPADTLLAAGEWSNFEGRLSTGWYRGELRRLSPSLYLVVAEGFSRDSVARQLVGLFLTAEEGMATPRRLRGGSLFLLF